MIQAGDTIRNKDGVEFIVTSITSSAYFGERNLLNDKLHEIAFKENNPELVKKATVRPISKTKDVRRNMLIRHKYGLQRVFDVRKYDDGYTIRIVPISLKRKPRETDFGWLNEIDENMVESGKKLEIIKEDKSNLGLFKFKR